MNNLHINRLKIIYDVDLFGKVPELYYKGKKKKVTMIGTLLTILYFILYIIIFTYKFIRMIKRQDIKFYETYAYTGKPSIKITNENFYGGFSLGITPFIDETIYYPKLEYWTGIEKDGYWDWTPREVEIEICQIEKFDSKYMDLFKNKPLHNMYCIKDINNNNFTLEGDYFMEYYSYFNITLYPCIGTTKNGTKCQPLEIIDLYLKSNLFHFYIQDIELTPQNYHFPVQATEKVITGPSYKTLYQKIYGYFQIVNIETDNNIIGLDLFSDINTQQFLKYDESWIITSPNEDKTYDYGFPLCEIIIQLSSKVLTQKRNVATLIEIFGDVGGTMEIIFTIFSLISSFSADKLYRISLVNDLFCFDIDKKIILFKINEDSNKKKKITKKIYSQENQLSKIPLDNLINNKENINNNNKLVNESLRNLNFRNAKEKSHFSSTLRAYESEESINKKNYSKKIDIVNDLNFNMNKINQEEKGKYKKNKNKEIINQITVNKLHYFLCFICCRKKDLNNLLLDEAIKIIIKKLDIFEIFRKIYKAEKIKNKYIREYPIEMSKECIKNMKNIQDKTKLIGK